MKARELAKLLMEHPEADVLHVDSEYGAEHIGADFIAAYDNFPDRFRIYGA